VSDFDEIRKATQQARQSHAIKDRDFFANAAIEARAERDAARALLAEESLIASAAVAKLGEVQALNIDLSRAVVRLWDALKEAWTDLDLDGELVATLGPSGCADLESAAERARAQLAEAHQLLAECADNFAGEFRRRIAAALAGEEAAEKGPTT
jgi:hypothetical protein